MTLVVASLVERSIAGVSRSSTCAFDAGADVVEVRLDHVAGLTKRVGMLGDIRAAVDGPAIATYRSTSEGGRGRLRGERRRRLLSKVMDAGFEYVDLELVEDGRLLDELDGASSRPKVISSHHFSGSASTREVRAKLTKACDGAHIGKVAMPCEHAGHAIALAKVALEFKKGRRRFALMGLGVQGQLTRVCAENLGSMFAYACLRGRPAAPGQLEVGQQKRLLDKGSTRLGLIGHPVAHSVSKPMQEAALRSVGLEGVYMLLDFPRGDMTRDAVSTLFDLGFRGLNVTIPHKERAHRICDTNGRSAGSTGAVNTIARRRGRIVGENTDVYGFEKLVESKKVNINGASLLVVGAGGAARAVCAAAFNEGAVVTIAARRPSQAAGLARRFGAEWASLASMADDGGGFDVVVNSTPVGTKGTPSEAMALPEGVLKGCRVFVDLVYNPSTTRSMEVARHNGCVAHGGLEMLVRQGEEAFRIWTGKEPDVAKMRRAAIKAVGR